MKISKNDKYVSLILKCITVIAAVWGICLSATGGNRVFMGGRHVFMFFTIQSNIAIALICLIGAVRLVRLDLQTSFRLWAVYGGFWYCCCF